MKRWHDEKTIMAKNVRERIRMMHDDSGLRSFTDKRARLGYYRKQDAYDCGNPGCYICHCEKVNKYPRRQDVKADLKLKEGLTE